jgi:hypothetical protein
VRSSEKASERFRAGFLTSRSHDHGCPCPKRLPANPRRLLRRCQHKAPIRCVAERYTSGDVAVFSRTVLPSTAAALHMHDAAQYAPIIIALKPRLSCPSSSPTARPARSRQRIGCFPCCGRSVLGCHRQGARHRAGERVPSFGGLAAQQTHREQRSRYKAALHGHASCNARPATRTNGCVSSPGCLSAYPRTTFRVSLSRNAFSGTSKHPGSSELCFCQAPITRPSIAPRQ